MTAKRLIRVEAILGEAACSKLEQAHVCLVGYGAVGSFAAEALARTGIGHLRVIDADIYDESNINRQLGADMTTVGQSKVSVCQKRLLEIAPDMDLEVEEKFLDESTMQIIQRPFSDGNSPEIVIDAIDTLDAKTSLLVYCSRNHIPVFSSMGAARKQDPDQIRSGDISRTQVCPLAREIRKRLKSEGIVSGIRCVYSTEPVQSTSHHQPDASSGSRITRPKLGSLITITGAFGLRLASECIKMILDESNT